MLTTMCPPQLTSGSSSAETYDCPELVRSQTSSTLSSTMSAISPDAQARQRSLTEMLKDEVRRRRSAEDSFGTEEEDTEGAPPSRRRRSLPKTCLIPTPLYPAADDDLDEEPSELNNPSQLKLSSSREKLRRLMSAPMIDWEEIRKVQQDHYENQTLTDGNAPGGLGVRRNRSMYSKSSLMRRSIERLDRLVTGDEMEQQPEKRPQQRQPVDLVVGTTGLQRNASWCFSNGVATSNGIGIDRNALGRRSRLGNSSSRNWLALSRRKSPTASNAARSLGLVKPQRRQGSNEPWSLTEPGVVAAMPKVPMAARKAAWNMEVKATLDAAKASFLQGDL